MVTIKLKKPATAAPPRPPVRGGRTGVAKPRPTLAQAQAERAERAEREAQVPEPLRPRFGDKPPPAAARRDEREVRRPDTRGPRPADARRGAVAVPPAGAALPSRRGDASTSSRGSASSSPRGAASPHGAAAPSQRSAAPAAQRGAAAAARRDEGPSPSRGHRPPARPAAPPAPLRRPFDRPAPNPARDDDDDDDFVPAAHAPGSLRLSKRMSELGIASRREADEWIAKGWVRVDDRVVSELGSRVLPGQRVTVDAKAKYQQAQKVTVLVNKPVGYVSGQAEDGYEPASVLVTPTNLWNEDRSGTRFLREHLKSLVPAGRLDIDSVGLLVLTQDGRVAKQLIGEDGEVEKEYLVRVASAETRLPNGAPTLSPDALALLRHGLELDGEALRPATVDWVNADQLRFVLTQGKKRQIRRMCEAVGLQVLGLKRVRIGRVMLGDLPPGQWRYLRRDESFV